MHLPERNRSQPDYINPDLLMPEKNGPVSGSQLFQQRLAALRAGTLYTRLSPTTSNRLEKCQQAAHL